MAKVSISEVRRLTLPIDTAVDAVLQLDRDRGGSLSHGSILEARVDSGDDAGLFLSVRQSGTGDVEQRKFTVPEIAAAIINYCWQSRIPLPRHGTKTLEAIADGFTFTIETNSQLPRRHAALPPRTARKPVQPAEAVAEPVNETESVAEPVTESEAAPAAQAEPVVQA